MFDALSVRKAIESRTIVVRDYEHRLQLVGVREHADGGATLMIAIGATPERLEVDVPRELLAHPIAVSERVVDFARQTLWRGRE
jgi:hypothetical protein